MSGKFICVLGLVRRGPPRLVCQATLISCVTLGTFLNFSEPKFPRQDTWGNNCSAWVAAWAETQQCLAVPGPRSAPQKHSLSSET